MKTVRGVKKYAKQFLKSADLNEVPKILEQFEALAGVLQRDKGIRNLLVSPVFTDEERNQALVFLTQKMEMSLESTKYLMYLSSEKVLWALGDINKAITALYLEMKKRAKAVITTPAPLSKENEAKLSDSLKKITGRDIDLEFVMDPSLLGGVRIKVGSTMYDSSIKGQLGLLKDKLIKG